MMPQPAPELVPFYEGDLPAGLISVPDACREYQVPRQTGRNWVIDGLVPNRGRARRTYHHAYVTERLAFSIQAGKYHLARHSAKQAGTKKQRCECGNEKEREAIACAPCQELDLQRHALNVELGKVDPLEALVAAQLNMDARRTS